MQRFGAFYTGLTLALFGTYLTEPTLAAIAGVVPLMIGFVIEIRQEEELLTEHFGDAYDAYRKDVPALFPFIW